MLQAKYAGQVADIALIHCNPSSGFQSFGQCLDAYITTTLFYPKVALSNFHVRV